MFIDSNTAILSSAAIERLFSVEKDVLKPKRSGLTDQNFEMLVFLKGVFIIFSICVLFSTCFDYFFSTCFLLFTKNLTIGFYLHSIRFQNQLLPKKPCILLDEMETDSRLFCHLF